MDYKASGVDIDAGNEAVRRIRGLARSTFTPAVLSDIGSFGGLFRLEPGRFKDPVLVASAAEMMPSGSRNSGRPASVSAIASASTNDSDR